MGQLEESEERLNHALPRLETAATRIGESPSIAKVQAELNSLRQRCSKLEKRNEEASARLTSAIQRLRSLLDSGDGKY